jgi:adenylate kinase family enzyme
VKRARTPATDQRVRSDFGDDVPVRRVIIYGSSGSGKSVLASELQSLGLEPHVEIDLLAYDDDVHVEQAILRERFAASIAGDAWVVEGMHRDQIETAIPGADAFVWIDLPRRVIAYRLVTRTFRHAITRRPRHGRRTSVRALLDRDLPFIVKSVRNVPRRQAHARQLVELSYERHVKVVHLTSAKGVRLSIRELRPHLSDAP